MKNHVFSAALALLCAGALTAAQTPEKSNQTRASATTPSDVTMPQPDIAIPQPTATTLTGCLYLESDVPGRQPNIAERAGILEDYILATMDAGAARPDVSADADVAARSGTGKEAVGTSGSVEVHAEPASGALYKVEHLADDRLRELVGKRVEVTGHVDSEPTDLQPVGTSGDALPPAANTDFGPDAIDLPEFEAVSIRQIEGTCAPQATVR